MTWENFEPIYNEFAQKRIANAPAITAEVWDAYVGTLEQNGYKTVEQSNDHIIAMKDYDATTLYLLAIRKDKTITKYTFGRFDTVDVANFGLRRYEIIAEKTPRGEWIFDSVSDTILEG